MKTIAAEYDFPFVAALPKAERKSRLAAVADMVSEVERVYARCGPILPQSAVASILGVSRARVGQLVEEGRLESAVVSGRRYVLVRSLTTFQKGLPGRPKKLSMAESFKLAVKAGREVGVAITREAGMK